MNRTGAFLAALLLLASVARADELHLRDGTKIKGTIVGYEKNSFRVKTAYGYAVVEKSAVTSISISNTAAKSAEGRNPPPPSRSAQTAGKRTEIKNAMATREPVQAKKTTEETKSGTARAGRVSPPQPAVAENMTTPPAGPERRPVAASPAAETSPPRVATPPAPEAIREEVRGNLYINDTYGFYMYKPPDWQVIQGARAALPGAIVAMGTSDETTYLIIGLEPSGGTVPSHLASTNDRLASMFDGFEPSSAQPVRVAGLTAYAYHFHGAANHQQWTGTIVLLPRGNSMFTIFGVTSANGDLVQIQQNVIWRTISSLHFSHP